jgi:4'-phosphopantetheinyl transferase
MPGTARIGIARVEAVLAQAPLDAARWLSASEQARFAQLRVEARRAHYLAGHWLVRALLARSFGGEADAWSLGERRSLPPAVVDHDALRVSISHSGGWIAAAVADVPIGIDLERRGRVLDAALEPLLRNADESPGSLDADALLQRWVAKEAWLKRDHGSALPARLERLQLQAAPRDGADVRLDSHPEFHFAWAAAPECAVEWWGEPGLVAVAAFDVAHSSA